MQLVRDAVSGDASPAVVGDLQVLAARSHRARRDRDLHRRAHADLPCLLVEPRRAGVPVAGPGAARRAGLHEWRWNAAVLPAMAQRSRERHVLLAVHARVAARARGRRDPARHRSRGHRPRYRPRGVRRLRTGAGADARPPARAGRGRGVRRHATARDPERYVSRLPLLVGARHPVRCVLPRRVAPFADVAALRERRARRLPLHDPSFRRVPVGGGLRRVRGLRVLGRVADAAGRRGVGVHRIRAAARCHARVQPPRDRELHPVPHHRRRSARHVRLRPPQHRAQMGDDQLRRRHRGKGRRAQRRRTAAVPVRELPRHRRGCGRLLAPSPRAEHLRPARHRTGVSDRLLLLLGYRALGELRVGVRSAVLHPARATALHPDRDRPRCGLAPSRSDRDRPHRGAGRRHDPLHGGSPREQPRHQRRPGAVARCRAVVPRSIPRVRRGIRTVPAPPQPVLRERARAPRTRPLRH